MSPGVEFAYRFGRIVDGQHNYIPHLDQVVPIEEFLQGLAQRAQEEYPDHEVRIDRLVQGDEPDTAKWVPHTEFNPGIHTPLGQGSSIERTVTVEQPQEVNE